MIGKVILITLFMLGAGAGNVLAQQTTSPGSTGTSDPNPAESVTTETTPVPPATPSPNKVAPAPESSTSTTPHAKEHVEKTGVIDMDRTFELNIGEKRISEQNYHASTAVTLPPEIRTGLKLRIGADLTADRIDVLLRNVKGKVRFKGTLQPLLDVLNDSSNSNGLKFTETQPEETTP